MPPCFCPSRNRNFELDSSAYFFNLLYNYAVTPGVWAPEQLLNSTLVHDAVVTMLQVAVRGFRVSGFGAVGWVPDAQLHAGARRRGSHAVGSGV